MEDQNYKKQVPNDDSPFSDKDKVSKSHTLPVVNDTNLEKVEKERQVENESSSDDDDFDLDSAFECETCVKFFSGLKPLLQHQKSAKHYKMLQRKKVCDKIGQNMEDDQRLETLEDLVPVAYSECDTCKKKFSGPESYHQHLKSKIHHKKVAEMKLLEKVTGDRKINVEKLKWIYKQRKILQKDIYKAGAAGDSATLGETEDYDPNIDSHQFECKECDKIFTGVNPWYQHLVSKTHEKTLKQKQLFEKLKLGEPSESRAPTENIFSKDRDFIQIDDDVLTCRLCHMSFSGPESVADHLKSRGHAKKKEIKEWKMIRSAKSAVRPTVETKKTKALDINSVNQITEDFGATTLLENRPQGESLPQCAEDFSAVLVTPDNTPDNPTAAIDGDSDSKSHNSLLCYESYKEYKQIMNEIESKDQLM